MAEVKSVAVTMGMRVVAARVAAAKEVARAEAMAEVARVVAAEVAMARTTVEMAFDAKSRAKMRKGGRRMQATAAWRGRRR